MSLIYKEYRLVLGLFFLGNYVPKLVNTYFITRGLPDFTTRIILGSGGAITEFIIGFGILLGSHGLVNFLKYMRTAGLKREDD